MNNNNNNNFFPNQNIPAITNGEIEAIANENAVNAVNVLNIIHIDETIDDEFEVDSGYGSNESNVGSDISNESIAGSNESNVGSDISNDSDYQFEFVINDPTPFVMPDVDFNICPIHELRAFEFQSLYARELEENSVSEEDVIEILSWFTEEQLATNIVNDIFVELISRL